MRSATSARSCTSCVGTKTLAANSSPGFDGFSRWPSRLAVQAAVNLYRVLEEALNNVRKHSGANAVTVSFRMAEGGMAVVSVTDDGVGLVPVIGERLGLGMLGMRERALLLGGELSIEPVRPHGVSLTAVIPKERLL